MSTQGFEIQFFTDLKNNLAIVQNPSGKHPISS